MTTLHDRLADLAEDAPAARAAPRLWDRGVAYRRRRRDGTAVVLVAAVLALIALGSFAWLRSPAAVELLPADSPGGMPDRVFRASEWLPGTDGHPLGQLAAAYPTLRHRAAPRVGRGGVSLGLAETGVVAVSATTGEYRFLDLPDRDGFGYGSNANWSLSPDGRYIAYSYSSPDAGGQHGSTGFALYDTRTGQVRRHAVPGEEGVSVDQYFWTGTDTVVITYGFVGAQASGYSTTDADAPLVWNVHVEAPHDLVTGARALDVLSAGPGFVVVPTVDGYVEVDPETGTVLRDLGKHAPAGVWDPSATRIAASRAGNGDVNGITPVVISTLPVNRDGKVTREQVPGDVRVLDIYSWLDEDHLAVLQLEGVTDQTLRVVSLDIRTGAARPLVDLSAGDVDTQLAGDLLTGPTVPGIEPPTPVDPRQAPAIGAGIVVAAGVALIWWRRRVRP
jgi:hypothetical protein